MIALTNKLSQGKTTELFLGFLLAMTATILLIPARAQSILTPEVGKDRYLAHIVLSKSSTAILTGQIDPRSETQISLAASGPIW